MCFLQGSVELSAWAYMVLVITVYVTDIYAPSSLVTNESMLSEGFLTVPGQEFPLALPLWRDVIVQTNKFLIMFVAILNNFVYFVTDPALLKQNT